ncbi:MAG: ABC transporter substrate-binding protein [Pseudolabrys sp.]|jgi:putative ABC transport system substrate-binding protein
MGLCTGPRGQAGATQVIPVVFAAQMDPVGAGVVVSLARPGGNLTGLSLQQTDTAGKRLELLREVVPGLRRLAIIANVDAAGAVIETREIAATARALNLDVILLEIQRVEDIAPAIEALKTRADALYVATDPVVLANRVRTNALARGARLPTIYGGREYVEAGALMSYGPSWPHLFRRAAEYVDKILRGAKLGDIPVEQPTKFRTGHQSWHRKGARHRNPAAAACPCRRSDRIEVMSAIGT